MQRRRLFCLSTLAASAALGFGIIFYLEHIDWLAEPDPAPDQIEPALAGRKATVNVYDLGGFIDRQYLWRIAADRAVLERIAQHLALEPVAAGEPVPPSLWNHPPSWWPSKETAAVRFYKSPLFVADSRGSDGDHYFAMHDVRESVIYVWFKQNF